MSHCRFPDRDCPGLPCGHPLPCPCHTAVIDLGADPPTVTIPITQTTTFRQWRKLAEVAVVLRRRRR